MKVAILVYSLTGNTRHIADIFVNGLQHGGDHTVTVVDLIPVVKELLLHTSTAPTTPALSKAIAAVETADVVGLGTLVWNEHAAPMVVDAVRAISRTGALRAKPAFFFTTSGGNLGHALTDLYDVLVQVQAVPIVEWHACDAPDNWYACAPPPGAAPYLWGEDTLVEAAHVAQRLATLLTVGPISSAPMQRPAASRWFGNATFDVNSMRGHGGARIVWHADKCVHCKACVELCPGNALNIEDSNVSWNEANCYGCTRCVALCPKKALTAHGYEGCSFNRFKLGVTTRPGRSSASLATMFLNLGRNWARNNHTMFLSIVIGFAVVVLGILSFIFAHM